MSTLKKVLLIFVAIIALPFVIALFLKNEYSVQREVIIQKPRSEVFNYIKYLKNQNAYSKWAKLDPNMKNTFTGVDATPGFISAWSSDKKDVGKGEQEIKKIVENERVEYEIRFIEPIQATSPAFMALTALNENQTKVTWGFSGRMPYPFNLMYLFFDPEKEIGNDLTIGLSNLNTILSKE